MRRTNHSVYTKLICYRLVFDILSRARWQAGGSKELLRVEQQCNWPFVDELHVHHGAKPSGLDRNAALPGQPNQRFIERFGRTWCHRTDKRGATTLSAVTVERKLADEQKRAAHVSTFSAINRRDRGYILKACMRAVALFSFCLIGTLSSA